MTEHYDSNESLTEMFIFESSQFIQQLEISMLNIERTNTYTLEWVNEVFRAMHTIKGSSSVMMLTSVAAVSHAMEDLFFYIRANLPEHIDLPSLSDIILEGIDFIKVELHKFKHGEPADGDPDELTGKIKDYLGVLQSAETSQPQISPAAALPYQARIRFTEACDMENVRAFSIVHQLTELASDIRHEPAELREESSAEAIRLHGMSIQFHSAASFDELHAFFSGAPYVQDLELAEASPLSEAFAACGPSAMSAESAASGSRRDGEGSARASTAAPANGMQDGREALLSSSSIISVHVAKMDSLMDLVGELVIAEAMVTQNPELQGLELDHFHKAARQLRKITGELQDLVMSIRMVPLAQTFHKMNRIVRDMSKKLDKEVVLTFIGEETGVDKNIIDFISDPLMHLVRNAVDHGIEAAEERRASGKPEAGTVTLEAKNEGGDVLVIVRDDGKGLNAEKLLKRAQGNGLLRKAPEDMTEKEIYQLIFLPGFSTKEDVTEFSGRGVGMDVVAKNIESIGGTVSVDSVPGGGTTMAIKIPLTLAIIDGMNIRVGASRYTLPTVLIKQSFRADETDVIADPGGNEMIMVRGQVYPILRLNELYGVQTNVTRLSEGILIMVEHAGKSFCLFADELLGQQQVVVKALPPALQQFGKVEGLAGCTLLGDGSISLILDVGELHGTFVHPLA